MRISSFASTCLVALITAAGLLDSTAGEFMWDEGEHGGVFPGDMIVPSGGVRNLRNDKEEGSNKHMRELAAIVTVGVASASCVSPAYTTIAAALATEASGVTIELCAQTYNEAVVIPPNYRARIKGKGVGQTIILAPSSATSVVFAASGKSRVSLIDLTLDGNNSLDGAGGFVTGLSCQNKCAARVNRAEVKRIGSSTPSIPSFGIFASKNPTVASDTNKIIVTKSLFPDVGVLGIFVNGQGTKGLVQRNKLRARNPAVSTLVIGIQVSRQAVGTVDSNRVVGFGGTTAPSTAINTVCPSLGTEVTSNFVEESDLGVALIDSVKVNVESNAVINCQFGVSLQFEGIGGADCPLASAVSGNLVKQNKIARSDFGVRLVASVATPVVTGNVVVENGIEEHFGGIGVFAGEGNLFSNNQIGKSTSGAIGVFGGKGNKFTGNKMFDSDLYGILVQGGEEHEFIDNRIVDADDSGIAVSGGTLCYYKENEIQDSGVNGVMFFNDGTNPVAEQNTVSTNTIVDSGDYGINVLDGNYNTFEFNVIVNYGIDGINPVPAGTGNVFNGNTVTP